MKQKKFLLAALVLAVFMMQAGVAAFAAAEDVVINVTAADAQEILNGRDGSIDGKTIHFMENIDDVLILAKPSAYQGSNTSYYHFNGGAEEPWSEDIGSKMENASTYVRTISNVTFTAEPGVVLGGFRFAAAHNYQDGWDAVRGVSTGNGSKCFEKSSLKNIRFEGLTINSSIRFDNSMAGASVDGVTITGCTFNGDEALMSNAEHRAIAMRSDIQYYSNVHITNCSMKDYYQGIYMQGVDNLNISNNLIDNTKHNAIAMQNGGSAETPTPVKGIVNVCENYITNAKDRAMRFGNITGTADITLNNNIMVNTGNLFGQNIAAATVESGSKFNLENNYWNGKSISLAVGSGLPKPEKAGIAGGTFSVQVLPEYCAEGFNPVNNGDGTFGVEDNTEATAISKAGTDALAPEEGTGTLRFITKVDALEGTVESFGTWILPMAVFESNESDWAKAPFAKVEYTGEDIKADETFAADLTGIPQERFEAEIIAQSYIIVDGKTETCLFDKTTVSTAAAN